MSRNRSYVPALLLALHCGTAAMAQRVLYSTDFDDAQGWTLVDESPTLQFVFPGARWAVDGAPAAPMAPFVSAPSSLNFNHGSEGFPMGLYRGHADSPVIDLGGAFGPVRVVFEYGYRHEGTCEWDAFTVSVIDALDPNVVRYEECLSATSYAFSQWRTYELPLDPSWGAVRIRFGHDTIDGWNVNQEQGSFVDDLRVIEDCGASVHCEGRPQSNGSPGADLWLTGTTSIAAHDLQLVGSGFPTHTYAAAFAGPDVATIPIGAGVRCIGVGSSVRLTIAPTRAQGAPVWALELGAAPLAQLAVAGQPLYVQAIFRDGTTVNLSDALEIALCP